MDVNIGVDIDEVRVFDLVDVYHVDKRLPCKLRRV